jgi:hypothetical protein
MTPLTRQQREALKRVYDRTIDFCEECATPTPRYQLSGYGLRCSECDPGGIEREGRPYGSTDQGTYRQFRRAVLPELGGDGAVMVQHCGMWLGPCRVVAKKHCFISILTKYSLTQMN